MPGEIMSIQSKPPSVSSVEMNELVLPTHGNSLGTVFGGAVMAWIDICAAMSAQRHARSAVVTASMDRLNFINSVKVGHVMNLRAMVNYCGHTSMEVGVRIEGEDPLTGHRVHAASAYLTFVALGEDGRPAEVPRLKPETPDELRRQEQALLRRQARQA
jgi:acyl-CoA hydrolase